MSFLNTVLSNLCKLNMFLVTFHMYCLHNPERHVFEIPYSCYFAFNKLCTCFQLSLFLESLTNVELKYLCKIDEITLVKLYILWEILLFICVKMLFIVM